jgi:hypothetical protein
MVICITSIINLPIITCTLLSHFMMSIWHALINYIIITSSISLSPPTRSAHHTPNNLFSNSPLGLSPHSQQGSESPDRRISNSGFTPRGGSPLNQSTRTSSPRSPPPGADCPHPTRTNSLAYRSLPHSSLGGAAGESPVAGSYTPPTQPGSTTSQAPPMSFQRTTSQPNVLFVGDKNSPGQRRNTISAEERIRLSLRVSTCT